MWGFLGRWIFRVFVALAAAFIAVYAGDWVVYHLRGSPSATVTVSRYLSVPLKGNRVEFDYLGTRPAPCARALFPHQGQDPCWLLRRNPNEWENLSEHGLGGLP